MGVTLENLSVLDSANEGITSIVAARGTVDLRTDHINVLDLSADNATSIAIGLTGNMFGVRIDDTALIAERGIAAVAGETARYVLTGEMHIARNLFFCSQHAVSFHGMSLHYANTRIERNFMLVGNGAAIVATDATLPGSPFTITGNVIYTGDDGIRGVDALTIDGNEIADLERSGDGIVLEEGFDPVALDLVRVRNNRIVNIRGNAIVVAQAFTQAIIEGIGLGAFVMSERSAASQLSVTGNQRNHVDQAVAGDVAAFAAIQPVRVEGGDILDK